MRVYSISNGFPLKPLSGAPGTILSSERFDQILGMLSKFGISYVTLTIEDQPANLEHYGQVLKLKYRGA